jgi:hypothetical protein
MVSQANATKGSTEGIRYIMDDKGQAVELDRNMISGETPTEILAEFREIQSLKPSITKNTYSIYLSPDNVQKEFTKDQLQELGQEHLKELGLEKNQYLMTLHTSTGKPHIHFQVNRIGFDGQAHNDSNISKKAQSSAEKLAKERGLLTAKDIRKMHKEKTKELRKEIHQAYNQSKSKATSFEEFARSMHNRGYNVELTKQKSGKIQGFRIVDRQSSQSFKASEIGKEVRYGKLEMSISENIQQKIKKEKEAQIELKPKRDRSPGLSR